MGGTVRLMSQREPCPPIHYEYAVYVERKLTGSRDLVGDTRRVVVDEQVLMSRQVTSSGKVSWTFGITFNCWR
jgi:hypothetical protein